MDQCSHISDIKHIGSLCDNILIKTLAIKDNKTKIICLECKTERKISICLECFTFLCNYHIQAHEHNVNFNVLNRIVNCKKCKEIYLLDGAIYNSRRSIQIKIPSKSYKLFDTIPLKGITNAGNTCYMGAPLFILMNLEAIRHEFLSVNHKKTLCGIKTCLICGLKSLFEYLYGKRQISIHKFLYAFWNVNSEFIGNEQHDTHDFFISFCEKLHFAFNVNNVNEAECKCIVHKNFRGTLVSTLSCTICKNSKYVNECFITLSIDCHDSIQASLQHFFQLETLSEALHCKCCNTNTQWTKKIDLLNYPQILCFHIKRFTYDGVAKKNNLDVLLNESLNLKGNKYDLLGFVCHIGNMKYGHYMSYIKLNDIWYKQDDDIVSPVLEIDVPKNNSYLVFYVNRNTRYLNKLNLLR